jgi:hypothetical protein
MKLDGKMFCFTSAATFRQLSEAASMVAGNAEIT